MGLLLLLFRVLRETSQRKQRFFLPSLTLVELLTYRAEHYFSILGCIRLA
jgi:hypothetical protein